MSEEKPNAKVIAHRCVNCNKILPVIMRQGHKGELIYDARYGVSCPDDGGYLVKVTDEEIKQLKGNPQSLKELTEKLAKLEADLKALSKLDNKYDTLYQGHHKSILELKDAMVQLNENLSQAVIKALKNEIARSGGIWSFLNKLPKGKGKRGGDDDSDNGKMPA